MNKENSLEELILEPHPDSLIESLRDVGYSLDTAIADIIDNSITASAKTINLFVDTTSEDPAIGILDDGFGMSREELIEAMRAGSKSPNQERSTTDLGRFGLGLKTASFSQCRKLTVVSRKYGQISAAQWNLDHVVATGKWSLKVLAEKREIPWIDEIQNDGTLIVWQALDRINSGEWTGSERKAFVSRIDNIRTHLGLVFHRFLSNEIPGTQISLFLNHGPITPYDPFNSSNPTTQVGPEEIIPVGAHQIKVQPYTLPHHQKVSEAEWSRFEGEDGYIKSQGFYLYRNRRLIQHGTWFGLARQIERTKLSRVRVDMPSGLDAEWKINIKKDFAQPPNSVKLHLKRIISPILEGSKRAYTGRGTRQIQGNPVPVWTLLRNKGAMHFEVNNEHPTYISFEDQLNQDQVDKFSRLMELIAASLPYDALHSEPAEGIKNPKLSPETLNESLAQVIGHLQDQGEDYINIKKMLESIEPYRSMDWDLINPIFDKIYGEVSN